MWEKVGPFRNREGLNIALSCVRRLRKKVLPHIFVPEVSAYDTGLADWYELRAGLDVAEAVALAAVARLESRGAHQREDYPQSDPELVKRQTLIHVSGSLASSFGEAG
jgi:succinate dehydrogenase/fumarate reductase flavoprotein subunit